jgi:hypothetical protein
VVSLTKELVARFPEISADLAEDAELSYLQMHSIVHWLVSLPTDQLTGSPLIARLKDFADWCETQPEGAGASDDIYTIFVVGLLESLFSREETRRLIPHLVPQKRYIESASYLRQWVGDSEYYEVLALYDWQV